ILQELVGIGYGYREAVAILELDPEHALQFARLHPTGTSAGQVVEISLEGELADRFDARGPRRVASGRAALTESVPAQEAYFRIEVVADEDMVENEPVEVAVVGETSAIALVRAGEAGGPRLGDIPEKEEVVEESDGRV